MVLFVPLKTITEDNCSREDGPSGAEPPAANAIRASEMIYSDVGVADIFRHWCRGSIPSLVSPNIKSQEAPTFRRLHPFEHHWPKLDILQDILRLFSRLFFRIFSQIILQDILEDIIMKTFSLSFKTGSKIVTLNYGVW